jgi:hypothetical protein
MGSTVSNDDILAIVFMGVAVLAATVITMLLLGKVKRLEVE